MRDGTCPHKKMCADLFRISSCDSKVWYECSYYDKILDMMMEARDMARDHPPKDEIPFFDDDYDGPEVED